MAKKSIFALIVSAVLMAGVIIAGCMQDSGSALQPGDGSPSVDQTPSPFSMSNDIANNEQTAFNLSGAQNRSPLSGMMNGTPPHGMNGTLPSIRSPSGLNGTPPSGSPPAGVMNRTPSSGTPLSGS